MTRAQAAAHAPPVPVALVVLPREALAELVTEAVAAALGGVNPTQCAPLLDRVGIAKALNVSVATVDRLVRQGMPCVRVAEARRFSPPDVLEWLGARNAAGRR